MRKFGLIAITAVALPLMATAPALAQNSGASSQNQAQQSANQNQAQQSPNQNTNENQNGAQNLSQSEIRQMQQALDQKGFKSGRADGKLGPETKNALKQFQSKQGLQQTGMPDDQTLAALGIGGQGTTGQAPSGQQNGASQNQNQNSGGQQNQPAPSK